MGEQYEWEFYNTYNSLEEAAGPYGSVTFQHGVISENGINGTTIEDVVQVCIDRLKNFQAGEFACRENALAITAFEEGINWLIQRTRTRERQGVEGINVPHK